jgi:hypothetical protein
MALYRHRAARVRATATLDGVAETNANATAGIGVGSPAFREAIMWWILALVAAVAIGVMPGIREVRSWRKPAKGDPEGLRNPYGRANDGGGPMG